MSEIIGNEGHPIARRGGGSKRGVPLRPDILTFQSNEKLYHFAGVAIAIYSPRFLEVAIENCARFIS
jgi:hypothetical protein